jgi:hypothetical protein
MLLPQDLRLTPEQFALVCNANPDAVLELSADGSVLSPDASVVRLECWQALSPEQRRGFPPLCPDLVIELASASDDSPRGAQALRRKMAAYQANGAQLGWLLFPEQRAVEIWRAHTDSGAAATQSAWTTPCTWRAATCFRSWYWSWRRSGRREPWAQGLRTDGRSLKEAAEKMGAPAIPTPPPEGRIARCPP